MVSRRNILKLISRLFLWTTAVLGLGMSWGTELLAKFKKRILPKNTDIQGLKNTNPAHLDTRNLPVMPLEAFGTMGDKEAPFKPETWRLAVSGAVKSPFNISYQDILALPSIEREILLVCPGVFVNHGRWKGISIQALMHIATPNKDASQVFFYGHSRFEDRKELYTIEEVKSDQVFLAYAVNGKPLPRKHGYPLRVVAEGHWGSHWLKYVKKIEFA
ncbi:MAG: molybdopterin-dependent oxidoreductase [Desulfobacterales bacterium]|nr:molybdopterin-dependent oxidoreductase [Desulfobacterales bacterium]MDJ0913909.1 molybdopterin-dependent oxidoreductase [Desulfobacterales bacterium]